MTEKIKEYSHTYFLTAGESNAEKEMPLGLILSRIIEVATEHANMWGVGYSTLVKENQAWVLSRVSVEMTSYPKINENYTFTTWIEDYNRHFSQRDFAIYNSNNEIIGYARTIWVVINSLTRESVDISKFSYMKDVVSNRECLIEKQGRLQPVTNGEQHSYRFKYADIDMNRHVNTVKYVEHLLNHIPLETFDKNFIKRFEIAFTKECYYDQEVTFNVSTEMPEINIEITSDEKTRHCRAKFLFSERN